MLPLEMLLLVPKGWKIAPWPCCSRGACRLRPKTLLLTCWRRSRKGSVIMLCRNFHLDCAPTVFGKGHLCVRACARARAHSEYSASPLPQVYCLIRSGGYVLLFFSGPLPSWDPGWGPRGRQTLPTRTFLKGAGTGAKGTRRYRG